MRAIDSLPMLFATLLFCGAAVAQDNPFAPDQQTGALNAEAFSNLRRSMNEVKHELSRYKQALNQSQLDLEASRQQTADIQDSQLKLLKTLLKSDDVATQQIGLEQLATSSSTELQGFFRLDDESISILDRFAESEDPTIRKQAIKSLIAFTPKSLELGFQRGERFWLPVAPSTEQVRKTLHQLHDFVYDATPLDEVVEELGQRINVNFTFADKADGAKLVSLSLKGVPLTVGLQKLFAVHGLTWRIGVNQIEILPVEYPRTKVSLTYNLRGLKSERTDVAKIVSMMRAHFDEPGKAITVDQLDSNRILIEGTEFQQNNVSEWLAGLARPIGIN